MKGNEGMLEGRTYKMEERCGSQEEKGVSNVIPFELAGRIRKSGRQAGKRLPSSYQRNVKKNGKSAKKREGEREKYGDFFSSYRMPSRLQTKSALD